MNDMFKLEFGCIFRCPLGNKRNGIKCILVTVSLTDDKEVFSRFQVAFRRDRMPDLRFGGVHLWDRSYLEPLPPHPRQISYDLRPRLP